MTALFSPNRHPGSFSLGFGLFLSFLLALPLSIIGNWRSQVLREHQAGRRLRELGGVTDEFGVEYKLNFALPVECREPIHIYGFRYWSWKDGGSPVHAPVTGEVVELLSQLPNLSVLCLSGERQAGVSFAPFSRRAQLEYLTLDCDATDKDVLCFHSQRKLKMLELNRQPVTDACLSIAECNSNITHIELNDTAITDEGLRTLGKLNLLQVLKLERTRITSSGLRHFHGMEHIHNLDLEGTRLDDLAIPHLAGLHSMRWVNLKGTRITSEGIARLRSLLPSCNVESESP